MAKHGLANVITRLHHAPGIDRDEDPSLFDFAIDRKEAINQHLLLEGMQLAYDLQLGVVSAICLGEDQIARYCQAEGIEPFRPVYTPRSEDYWSSVLIVILRLRYETSLTNPETAWIDEEDLFAEFETFVAQSDRDNSAKSRQKMKKILDDLIRSRFVAMRSGPRADQYAATKWLVLRLSSDIIEDMIARMRSYVDAASVAAEDEGDIQEDLPFAAEAGDAASPDTSSLA